MHFELSQTFLPSPRWNVTRPPLFGLQGGGVNVGPSAVANFVRCNIHANGNSTWGGGLYIAGTATLTNTNVFSNEGVCARLLALPDISFIAPLKLPLLTKCCARARDFCIAGQWRLCCWGKFWLPLRSASDQLHLCFCTWSNSISRKWRPLPLLQLHVYDPHQHSRAR